MRLPHAARAVALATVLTLSGGLLPASAAPDGPPGPRDVPEATADPFSTDVGAWSVVPDDAGGWRVSWTAPEPLRVGGAQPRVVTSGEVGEVSAGAVLGDATVGDDGRTMSLRVPGATAPDPETLDVRLGGRVLDEPLADVVDAPVVAPTDTARSASPDPGALGRHRVVTRDYTRPAVRLPGLDSPVEVVGHVEAPADATRRSPLVVLMHGRHTTCTDDDGAVDVVWPCPSGWKAVPSHLGFHYLQQRLASQGFVTVSVSANGITAQDGSLRDGGALARARLLREHLDLWAERVDRGRWQADISRVVLLGHDRGGEGAALAALETPLSAAYRVRGLVLLAPTNLGRRATPYLPTVTVLGSCDGDVLDLQGQSWTDAALGMATGDTALHSSVMVVGADHDRFNGVWSAAPGAKDGWSGTSGPCAAGALERLSASAQQRVARTYVAGAVRLLARGATDFLPLYDGSPVAATSAGDAVVLSHAVGAGRATRQPGADAVPIAPARGATAGLCRGVVPAGPVGSACGRTADDPWSQPVHWPVAPSVAPTRRAFELGWTEAGGAGGLSFRAPWDVSGSPALDLRTIVDPARGPVSLDVRLTDARGRTATVTGRSLSPLPGGGESPSRLWAQALRVPLSSAGGIDLRRLASVELVGRSDRGRLWVLDVAAVRRDLPAVPARRVPLLDLGSVTVREGDRGTVAAVPYRLRGTLRRDAVVRLGGLRGLDDGLVGRVTRTVPAGSSSGTLRWPVQAGRSDSAARSAMHLTAYGVSEVVAGRAYGRVTVVDDDPPPTVRVRAVRDRVREGGTLRWVVSWSPSSDYTPVVRRRLLRGSAGPADLRDRWPAYRERALAGPGTQRWVVRVPVREDATPEGREVVRVRVAIPRFGWRTVLTGVIRGGRIY